MGPVTSRSKYYWMAARGVEMSEALPEYSLANGGLEETRWDQGKRSLGEGGSSKEGRLGVEEEVSL